MVRERSRVVKIKNIKKQNLLYGCFKKQSTQKISNQKMKLKERDKSILERERESERKRERETGVREKERERRV